MWLSKKRSLTQQQPSFSRSSSDLLLDVDGDAQSRNAVNAVTSDSSDIEPDVDSSALTQPDKKSRHWRLAGGAGKWFPDGPKSLAECMEWNAMLVAGLQQRDLLSGSQSQNRVLRKFRRGVVFTSSFSGVGSAEIAMAAIHAEVQRRCMPVFSVNLPAVVFWAATDACKHARKVLLAHGSRSQPLHIFGDLLERLPKYVVDKCKKLEAEKLALGKASLLEVHAGKKSRVAHKEVTNQLGMELMQGLQRELQGCIFEEKAWCYKCSKNCHISPRFNPEHTSDMWLEIAGSVCCPFSSINVNAAQWLDKATLPFMVWAYCCRAWQPDQVYHECVLQFQPLMLSNILNEDKEDDCRWVGQRIWGVCEIEQHPRQGPL